MVTPGRNWASTFADWVYKHTVGDESRDLDQKNLDLKQGRVGHETKLASICKSTDFSSTFRRTEPKEWRFLYVDNDKAPRTYSASRLVVDGLPLRCRPDLIIQHRTSHAIALVEHKYTSVRTKNWTRKDGTRRVFSPYGYPNNRAQLWCYANIDDFRSAQPLLLVLQFRSAKTLDHIATISWFYPHAEIDTEASAHFLAYGGAFAT